MKQTASLVLAILALGVRADVKLAVYAIDGTVKAECALKDEVWQEVRAVFDRGIELRHLVQERLAAYNEYATAMGFEEMPMSASPIKAQVAIDGEVFYFEEDGALWCDPRFILPEERWTVEQMEAYYRAFCMTRSDAPAPAPAEPEIAATGREPAANPPEPQRKLPVFRGFEDPRYQQYDELIIRYTDEFNRNRAAWADATPGQAESIHELRPALVKSHMIEESGGSGPKSRKAWMVDPIQVNVPGDWDPIKLQVGLKKPSRRNEGTAAQNVKAAIKYLVRKGFGASGAPAKIRPGKKFDGWYHALRRYNGRNARLENGKRYKDAYAERILKRAESPHAFVPIAHDVQRQRKSNRRKATGK